MNVSLVRPALSHGPDFHAYLSELERADGEIIPASCQLDGTPYEAWLRELEAFRKKDTCPDGYVPADTFFAIDENGALVGAINIRHELNEYLLDTGGNVAYSVRPRCRNRGCAKAMMAKIKAYAKTELSLDRLLVTCNKDNAASAKTIIASGGVLEDERMDKSDGQLTQRYWIELGNP